MLQTCLPDYRLPFFRLLHDTLGDTFSLVVGPDYFDPTIQSIDLNETWIRRLTNYFLLGRRLLWQVGSLKFRHVDLLFVEMNPRTLTTWMLLIHRRLLGKRSIVWGHAWSRKGRSSLTNKLRLCMMKLSTGVITYTQSHREEVRVILGKKYIQAAPNAVLSSHECYPASNDLGVKQDIIFVGRLVAAKKPRLLLEGFRLAQEIHRLEGNLIIVGEGPERVLLEDMVRKHRLQDSVLFYGQLSDIKKLRDLYATALCSVSPGYVGLSAIQSFAFGVPMLIADAEFHSPEIEACIPDFNCMYFQSDSAVDLARKLDEVQRSREKWIALKERISSWTADNYTFEAMAQPFLQFAESRKKVA